jgi:hypothetical protein
MQPRYLGYSALLHYHAFKVRHVTLSRAGVFNFFWWVGGGGVGEEGESNKGQKVQLPPCPHM